MRLLKHQRDGGFILTSFADDDAPPYAILSHTWTEGQEVTYSELVSGTHTDKAGYDKIRFCMDTAARDGLKYCWIDTCCIDKSVSDEVSTAINSMFRWYQRSTKCYVYLSDVVVPEEVDNIRAYRITWEYTFRRSRWFTRGWTLQELLAPGIVEFYSKNYKRLGSKVSLEQDIHEITKIPITALRGQRLSEFSIMERMGWAAKRTTTRKEDKVYCLLGIFGVYMSLIYGEEEENASMRLREEIQKRKVLDEEREGDSSILSSPPLSRNRFFVRQADQLQSYKRSSYNPSRYSSPHFTGRQEYLNKLVTFFSPRHEDDVPVRREFLLFGMGGTGKTQICLKFAEQHSNMFWRVFWIDATNQDTLKLSLQEVGADTAARSEAVDDSFDSVVRWLSRAPREWLLIFDNVDGSLTNLDTYLPSGRRGNVLFTSRDPFLRRRMNSAASQEVGEMEREDAKLLLRKVSHLETTSIDDIEAQLSAIVDELHSTALAIDHAGAAILKGDCVLEDFVARLKSHRPRVLANPNFLGSSGYNKSIYSTWSLTTTLLEERACKDRADISPHRTAIQLLNMFAFFHNNFIMEDTFRRAAEASHGILPLAKSSRKELPMISKFLPHHLLPRGNDGMWDPSAFRDGIGVLRSFSLIQRVEQRVEKQLTYSIHPLVHLWARERMAKTEQRKAYLSVFAILSKSIQSGDGDPGHSSQYCRRIIPHLLAFRQAMATENMTETFFDDGFANFAHAFFEHGLGQEAEHFASELKIHRSEILGERNAQTLQATEILATVLRSLGSPGTLERSSILFENTYCLRMEILDANHPDTVRAKMLLGGTHQLMGNFSKAEELLRSALHSAQVYLGEAHATTLGTVAQLSALYRELGNNHEAEGVQRKNVEILQRKFGDENLRTVEAMANLAATLTNLGKLDESETLKVRIAELRTKYLGRTHPDTIMAQANLAATYCKQKRWKEAEQTVFPVIQWRIETFGELHRETLRSRLILTNCYIGQNRLSDAESQCKQVVEGRKTLMGEEHCHTLWSMHKLAYIYASQNRLGEAIELWYKTLAIQQKSKDIGAGHEETQEVMHHLACTLYRQGQKEEASRLMESALALKKTRLLNELQHPTILASEDILKDWTLAAKEHVN